MRVKWHRGERKELEPTIDEKGHWNTAFTEELEVRQWQPKVRGRFELATAVWVLSRAHRCAKEAKEESCGLK